MAELRFYTRVRGKVSGPFDVESLQKLVRRGMLARMHQVSADQKEWHAAGEYEELFPGTGTPGHAPPRERLGANTTAAHGDDGPPTLPDDLYPEGEVPAPLEPAADSYEASPSPDGQYFYLQEGAIAGPVSFATLRACAGWQLVCR